MVALKEAFIVGGILTGYISGAAFAPLGPESWRLMFGAALAVEIPGLILANTIPESPRWLCLKAISAEEEYEGYIQRAEECQALLSGGDTQKAKGDVQDMLQSKSSSRKQKGSHASLNREALGSRSLSLPRHYFF